MKIIIEEIKQNPLIFKTTPFAGVKEVSVSIEIEKGDKCNYNVGDIIKYPFILYVWDRRNLIEKNNQDECSIENLIESSKKHLDEWIKKI